MKKLLVFNPLKRLTVEDALQQPYVAPFHNVQEEPVMGYHVTLPFNDDTQLSVSAYRNKLYQLIADDQIVKTTAPKKSHVIYI